MATTSTLSDVVVERILGNVAKTDEAYVRRVVEKAKGLFATAAVHIEWHAALICCAEDPVFMLEVLRPVITDQSGAVHPLYRRIAERELHRRAAHSLDDAASAAVLN